MAIRDAQGLIRGKMGDIVFKVVNGKQVVYQVPDTVKQSRLTKKCATMFGLCSKQTALLMGKLRPWLKGKVDSKQAARLRGACLAILRNNEKKGLLSADLDTADMSDLKGFEFNIHAPFEKYFLPKIGVTETENTMTIKIPSYFPLKEISFPESTENVNAHLIVLHHNAAKNEVSFILDEQWQVRQRGAFEEERKYTVPSITEPGITLVIVQLLFFNIKSRFSKEYLNDKKHFPAQIVYAR